MLDVFSGNLISVAATKHISVLSNVFFISVQKEAPGIKKTSSSTRKIFPFSWFNIFSQPMAATLHVQWLWMYVEHLFPSSVKNFNKILELGSHSGKRGIRVVGCWAQVDEVELAVSFPADLQGAGWGWGHGSPQACQVLPHHTVKTVSRCPLWEIFLRQRFYLGRVRLKPATDMHAYVGKRLMQCMDSLSSITKYISPRKKYFHTVCVYSYWLHGSYYHLFWLADRWLGALGLD